MAVESIGLTPILPVIAEVGTVEIPDLARMTKLLAIPKVTGAIVLTTGASVVEGFVVGSVDGLVVG